MFGTAAVTAAAIAAAIAIVIAIAAVRISAFLSIGAFEFAGWQRRPLNVVQNAAQIAALLFTCPSASERA